MGGYGALAIVCNAGERTKLAKRLGTSFGLLSIRMEDQTRLSCRQATPEAQFSSSSMGRGSLPGFALARMVRFGRRQPEAKSARLCSTSADSITSEMEVQFPEP